MKRFRFRLLSLMIVVAMTALAAWGYALRRRSAEFASKASQHCENIDQFSLDLVLGNHWVDGGEAMVVPDLAEMPHDFERRLRYLEHYYGYRLTTMGRARRTLLLLWLRYEVHMYLKYRRAATRPWLPVDRDAPVPPLGPYPPPVNEWWRDRELQAKIAEYRKTFPNRVPE